MVGVWIGLPVALLSVFTAGSQAFAPERHLSFLMPGYAVALAALFSRSPSGCRACLAPIAAVVARRPAGRGPRRRLQRPQQLQRGLRNASLGWAGQFNNEDTLLSSAGKSGGPAEDPRLYTAYAALDAAATRRSACGGSSITRKAARWCTRSSSASSRSTCVALVKPSTPRTSPRRCTTRPRRHDGAGVLAVRADQDAGGVRDAAGRALRGRPAVAGGGEGRAPTCTTSATCHRSTATPSPLRGWAPAP